MPELLLELLSEEIPAHMQPRAADHLRETLVEGLDELKFGALLQDESVRTFVTPRRLVGVVRDLPAVIPALTVNKRGPRTSAPEKAIEGFARSVGVPASQLATLIVDGIEYHVARTTTPEQMTRDRIAEVIQWIASSFPFPKSMRWMNGAATWIRPLRSVVCAFDGRVVPGSISFAALDEQPGPSVPFGDETTGHPFLAPEPFTVSGFDDYRDRLRKAYVMLDAEERKRIILEGAEALAKKEGLRLRHDRGLLNEVAGLVEWPVPLIGSIDEKFLGLPPEVLMTTMRTHQRYFALETSDGALAPRFVVVAGTKAKDGGKGIVAGNERVLRARLADAEFFWNQDRRTTLASKAPALREIVFHEKLGTVDAKMDRVQSVAAEIAEWVPGAERDKVRSAARLAKADLVTGMVGEFPELQGIMGRYYALHDGESADVAEAIADHYAPAGPDDRCPTAPVSAALALADRIDTLAGFWAIGEKPTGSKDPFALRRAALGVIRLILENQLRVPLSRVVAGANGLLAESGVKGSASEEDVLAFFADRLKVHLRKKGVRHDLIAAVFALSGEDDLVRLLARVDALAKFLDGEDGADLLTAYRRAANIVRIEENKDSRRYTGEADPELLQGDDEGALAGALADTRNALTVALAAENFAGAMAALAALRGPVDAFFEHVTVNTDDAPLRENRLKLLSRITATLEQVADFSRIEG